MWQDATQGGAMRIKRTDWQGARWPPRRWQADALEAALTSIETGEHGLISAIMGAGKSVLLAELAASIELERDEILVITCPTQALVEQLARTLMRRLNPRDVGLFYANHKHLRPILVTCNDSMQRLADRLTHHHIRVPLWIADEAHRTESPQVKSAYETLTLQTSPAIGLTATPFRSDHRERLSLWDRLIYRYSAADAVRDGVIVPWRVISWTGEPMSLDDCCVAMIDEHRALGPGVANAQTIDEAEAFAKHLNDHDIPAAAVHSKLSGELVTERLDALQHGRLSVVVYVTMLAEGVDMPWLRWMCLRRRVGAEVRFAQEAGRITRADEGKTHGIILDPINLFSEIEFSTREMIGTVDEAPDEEPEPPPPQPEVEEEVREDAAPKEARQAVSLTALEDYLKQRAIVLVNSGVARRRVLGARQRHNPGTRTQRRDVRRLVQRPGVRQGANTMPETDREHLRAAMRQLDTLSHGALADLQVVLDHLARAGTWQIRPQDRVVRRRPDDGPRARPNARQQAAIEGIAAGGLTKRPERASTDTTVTPAFRDVFLALNEELASDPPREE